LTNGYMSFVETVRTKVENRSLATGLAEVAMASRAKSEFLANMSHELRTPLNAILGFSELIRGELLGPVGTAKYRDYASDIYESGQHLLRIINDVLDMSKIEVGRLVLRDDLIDVAAAARASIALVAQRAVAAGIALRTEIPDDLPILVADELRMKQILLNLLSNSVKFTRRLGSATVGAAVQPDGNLAIWVADTGIGMTKGEIALALEPFRQVDSDLARKYEGTGLGLPLARALVEMHGGRLEIVSTPGVGTTVTVLFPAIRLRPHETA
jgi:signal transduction histidine kinase